MEMVEVKTADLIGPALDWAVGEVEGEWLDEPYHLRHSDNRIWCNNHSYGYCPSTDWEQGGPLIEKHRPDLMASDEREFMACLNNDDRFLEPLIVANGPTYLIAACRAIAAAKLGAVVSVPAELMPR